MPAPPALTVWFAPHIRTLSSGSEARNSFTFWHTKCFFLVLVLLALRAEPTAATAPAAVPAAPAQFAAMADPTDPLPAPPYQRLRMVPPGPARSPPPAVVPPGPGSPGPLRFPLAGPAPPPPPPRWFGPCPPPPARPRGGSLRRGRPSPLRPCAEEAPRWRRAEGVVSGRCHVRPERGEPRAPEEGALRLGLRQERENRGTHWAVRGNNGDGQGTEKEPEGKNAPFPPPLPGDGLAQSA